MFGCALLDQYSSKICSLVCYLRVLIHCYVPGVRERHLKQHVIYNYRSIVRQKVFILEKCFFQSSFHCRMTEISWEKENSHKDLLNLKHIFICSYCVVLLYKFYSYVVISRGSLMAQKNRNSKGNSDLIAEK